MGEIDTKGQSKQHLDRHEGHEAAAASAQAAPTSVEPVTPQDSHAAGAAQPTQNELLQKNVSGSTQKGAAEQAKEHAEAQPGGTAGLHATGSETGTSNK